MTSERSRDGEALRERARDLRRADNPAEAALWAILRDRRKHGWKFRRQCVLGPFIADFYCAELRLVVEVDGRAHAQPDASAHDVARDDWLRERDIRTLRLPARLLLHDPRAAIARIEAAAAETSFARHAPLTAERAPLTVNVVPITDVAPLTADVAPLAAKHAPLTAEHAPLTAKHAPLTAERAPVAAKHAPVAAETTPPSSDAGHVR